MVNLLKNKWFISFVVLAILGNIILYNHAYYLTHFTEKELISTKQPIEQISWSEKLRLAFTGVQIPKPSSDVLPNINYETIYLNGKMDTLETWWMPHQKAKGIVILFHGYAGEKSSLLPYSYILNQLKYSTLLVDFRGSGGSSGNTTTIGYHEANDVTLAYHYIKRQFPSQQITLLGISMGAAATMKAVADDLVQPDKIILECPFESMVSTTYRRFEAFGVPAFPTAELLLWYGGLQSNFDPFSHRPVDYATQITTPTLLQFGAKDQRVNRSEIDNIYSKLAGEKQLQIYPDAGHEIYLNDHAEEWKSVANTFLMN